MLQPGATNPALLLPGSKRHGDLSFRHDKNLELSPSIIPSDLISPCCSATATEIVSAWKSKPRKFILFMDRLPSLVALYCLSSDSQHTPRLRIRAGHSMVTIKGKSGNQKLSDCQILRGVETASCYPFGRSELRWCR